MEMYFGDTREIELVLTDPENGDAPVNLNNVDAIWMTAKRSVTDLDVAAIFQLTFGNGIEVVNAAAGTALATITPGHFANLQRLSQNQALVYDVQIDRDGEVTTVAFGTLTIKPDVTHAVPT